MLFAESTPQGAEMGVWLAGFAAVAGLIVLILHGLHLYRQLTAEPPVPAVLEGDQLVRRGEWASKLKGLEEQMEAIAQRQIALEKYTHEAIHSIRDSLHQLRIAQETMRLQIHQSITQMVERLEARLGRNTNAVTRIVALLESHGHRPAVDVDADEEDA